MDSAVDDNNSSNGSSSSSSSSDGDDDGEQPPLPKLPVFEEDAKPKKTEIVTRRFSARESRKTIWENDYFYIPQAPPDSTGLRISVRHHAKSDFGQEYLSKQMTPLHFGETMESCTVTLLLLRAWSIWRAHRDDWASAKPCRKRQIDEDLSRLQRDVQKVRTQNGGSLGHKKADAVWASLERQCPVLAQ